MHATTAAAGVPFRDRPNQKMTQREREKKGIDQKNRGQQSFPAHFTGYKGKKTGRLESS